MKTRRHYLATTVAGTISLLGISRPLNAFGLIGNRRRGRRRHRDKTCDTSSSVVNSLPNIERWRNIELGMTEAEVSRLLGRPMMTTKTSEKFLAIRQHFTEEFIDSLSDEWFFGFIRFDSIAMPDDYRFIITIKDGKVFDKRDPFGGMFSQDGVPTIPRPISREKNTQYFHFPRFLDLRWALSSGKSPIAYNVEIDTGEHGKSKVEYPSSVTKTTEIPYASWLFPGKNPGRWRVRGENGLGHGEWSEYQYFEFVV